MSKIDGEVTVRPAEVVEFYNGTSGMWPENGQGEHLHLGFYDFPATPDNLLDHGAAALRMVEEVLKFSPISDNKSKWPKRVVDVGCGIGGSARYLAKKYGAHVVGITLSPLQVQTATALTAAQGLSDKVVFQVADALDQPFPDGQFDLVWALESAGHRPDKEKEVLDKICTTYYLPAWCSTADYVRMAETLSLQNIRTADWSKHVAPFWPAIINKSKNWRGIIALLKSGWKGIKCLLGVSLWVDGLNQGLIRYAVITAQKPV